jgi:hypothetical protein
MNTGSPKGHPAKLRDGLFDSLHARHRIEFGIVQNGPTSKGVVPAAVELGREALPTLSR